MRASLRDVVRNAAGRLGYEVHRKEYSHAARRAAAMRVRDVDVVLDVGGNTGQYVSWLRAAGYTGKIVSFEPIPEAFETLERTYGSDSAWRGVRAAAGAAPGTAILNVVDGSSVLSSMLMPTVHLQEAIPVARFTRQVEVNVVRLDDVWDDVVPGGSSPFLKVDTQGFEHAVLDGTTQRIKEVSLLEVEMSLVPIYEGGSSLQNLLPRLMDLGFEIVSIDSDGGFVQVETGQVLDINVLAGRPIR